MTVTITRLGIVFVCINMAFLLWEISRKDALWSWITLAGCLAFVGLGS